MPIQRNGIMIQGAALAAASNIAASVTRRGPAGGLHAPAAQRSADGRRPGGPGRNLKMRASLPRQNAFVWSISGENRFHSTRRNGEDGLK